MGAGMSRKIGFVVNSFAGGGAERILGYVVNSIDRSRFSPFLCLLLSPQQSYELSGDVPVQVLEDSPLPFHLKAAAVGFSALAALPLLHSPSRYSEAFRHSRQVIEQLISASLGLKAIIDRERPDVLVVFLQTSIVITLLTLIFFRLRLPVVCSDRILLSHELEGYRFPRLNRMLMRLLYRRIDVYLAVSEGVKRDMASQFGIPDTRIVTVYNGFDRRMVLERAGEPLSAGEQELFRCDGLVLITVGRLMEQKGHDDLLKAFALLRQSVSCRLILVGEGDRLDELRRLAEELGIADHVEFSGWTSNPFKLVAAADVFVLSSRYEGFPNVLLEAMALGKAVVSTDCPSGPFEILGGGRYGMLVPPGDHRALAEALHTICTDEAVRNDLQQRSRERAEDFTLERMVAAYEALLDSLSAGSAVLRSGRRDAA